MRRTKEQAEQTRQHLMETALNVFNQVGYEEARLGDIADEAGVTRGAIYHHFGNKAGLLTALIEDAYALGGDMLQQAIAEGGNIADITYRILVYTMRLLEDERRYRITQKLALSINPASPELQPLVKRRYAEAEMLVEQIGNVFQDGIVNGHFRADLNPATAARAFLAYQNGLAMLWLANQEAFSIKENAEALAGVFMQGIVG